jgi:predicted Zn-dependent protease
MNPIVIAIALLLARPANPLLWNVVEGVPLRVWVQPTGDVRAVRKAMAEWNSQRLPVQMRFAADSTDAHVRIVWTERFDEPISGNTTTVDDGLHLVRATVLLAHQHSDGRVLNAEETRVLALHELGHVLGLEHVNDSTSVMSPRVRVRKVSAADRARVQSLYAATR